MAATLALDQRTMNGLVLSLCDRSGVMVEPWLRAGYECITVDIQHPAGEHGEGRLMRIGADIRTWLPPREEYAIVFAFPPCTNLAVSGARWFRAKGLRGLIEGLELVERCREICEWSDAPWMLENPVSTLATYWRKPDHTFHPWEYAEGIEAENYTKKTCLWTGNGFVMPAKRPHGEPHRHDIWKMAPSPERGDLRSVTPRGFAEAVFRANHPMAEAA